MAQTFPEATDLDFTAIESEILDWWDRNDIFRRCVANRADRPVFTFYEGPPTANGRPGIHHVLGRTIKDVFCRYQTLKGMRVERKAGWDTHGLPVEIEVEKALGLEGREQIEAYGIARFNAACRESVDRYKTEWDALTRRIGYWVDLDDPYVTCETPYIESAWWLIKQIHERGLLYRGHKIQWYSPGSGTVLSSHEVSLGYQEVADPSVYVRFRSVDDPALSYLAWTTTPWTLISNVGLAVGPAIDYVKVRITPADGAAEFLVLAEARLEALRCDYEVVEHCTAGDLVGRRYEPLFRLDSMPADGDPWRIVAADFVSTGDGTGIVHMAPAFGADDNEIGRREGLPLVNPMQPDGHFAPDTPLVGGAWFKDADKPICRDLRSRGLLYRQDQYLHNYPHDWRKGTPLMSYPVESWFIRTTAVRDRLVDLNRTIHWHPPAIGEGRFGNWLENNIDWALSRKRYWGTPLPIWRSDREGSEYFEVIGSIAELRAKVGALPPDAELDLHRPFVDELTWPAPDGGTMRRVPDVVDVWFDSGAMPFAQWHYPFENRERCEAAFPADFICEGLDQTRGWFYTLHAIATLVRDDVAFRNVVVNGLILDENGDKMSKSRGNTVDPFTTVEEYGADLVRWYMMSNSPPWDSMKFSLRGLKETRNKFFSTLENVYRFMASYANIDGFRYAEARLPPDQRTELDQWILSRLNSTVASVDQALGGYDPTRAARAVETFVDELSNWYIRRSRPRFWAAKKGDAGDGRDKLAAYQTTFECLETVARLASAIAPFFSEWLYRALHETVGDGAVTSVHMSDMPVPEEGVIRPDLERRMGLARTIVGLTLLLRNRERLNVRQPLARLLVVVGGAVRRADVELVAAIILEEVNVERIEFLDDSSAVVKRSAKANFARLGKRFGKRMKAVAAAIAALDDATLAAFVASESLTLDVEGESVVLEGEDVQVSSEEVGDWSVAQEDGVTVALDTQLTPELKERGLAREVVNRIQSLRKTADLELTDRILIELSGQTSVVEAVHAHSGDIARETLGLGIRVVDAPAGEFSGDYTIGDSSVRLAISRDAAGQTG